MIQSKSNRLSYCNQNCNDLELYVDHGKFVLRKRKSMSKQWRKDYPDGIGVPPASASVIDMRLYRLVLNEKPNADDFLPSFVDPMQKHLVKKADIRSRASFYGTSFFTTQEKIMNIVKGSPERFAKQKPAVGQVKPEHGEGEVNLKSGHASMWFYDGIYPQGFKIL